MPSASTVAELAVVVSADTSQAEAGLSSLGQKVQGAGSALQTAFAGAAVAGIAAVGAGLTASVAAATDFEKTMSGVKAVSGATADEMAALQQTALDLGAKTAFSASEAGKGIEELVKGGLTVQEAMTAAEATLNLAAAGGISVADSATIAANALAQFNLPAEKMAHVSDLIAGAANASAIDVGQFKYSLQAAGAVANTVGFSFDDLAQGIAIMGKAGIAGSDAGTSLKTMMLNLQPSTNAQRDEFRRLGLETSNLTAGLDALRKQGIEPQENSWAGLNKAYAEANGLSQDHSKWTNKNRDDYDKWAHQTGLLGSAFFDANGKVKSMADVAEILKTSMSDMTEQQRLASLEILFGSDAIRAGAVLAKEGAEGFNDMAAAMGKVSAESVGAEKLNNLAGAWEQLTGSLETAAITIGLSLLPVLTDLVLWATQGVNDMLPLLSGLAKAFADAVAIMTGDSEKADAAFARLADALADALGPDLANEIVYTLTDIRTTFEDFLLTMRRLMDTDGSAMALSWKEMWTSMATETLLRTQDMLSGLRVVMAIMRGDWDAFWGELELLQANSHKRQAAQSETYAKVGGAILDAFTGGQATAWAAFFDGLDERAVAGWQAVATTTTDALAALAAVVTDAWTMIATRIIQPTLDAIGAAVSTTWTEIETSTDTVFRAIANLLTAIWDEIHTQVIKPKVDAIKLYLSDTWEAIRLAIDEKMQAVSSLVATIWETVKTSTETVLNAVLTFVRDTIFSPMRAAIETAINAARDLIGAAWDAVSTKAHAVLDPLLAYIRDTIFAPIKQAAETAMSAVSSAFETSVNAVKTTVDSTLGAVRSAWETTWTAIKTAAESPKQALDVLKGIIEQIVKVTPEWLIPHSPTPFQKGLEGVGDAIKALGRHYLMMGDAVAGANGEIADYIRNAAEARGIDPGVAIRIAQHEGGTEEYNKRGTFSTGSSWWPFQLHYGGKGYEYLGDIAGMGNDFTRKTGWGPGDPKAWKDSIDYALDVAARHGWSQWYGRGPAGVGAWEGIPGHAAGGWAGLHGPELAWLGERGPEYVVPNAALRGGSGAPRLETLRVDVAIAGRVAEEVWITGYQLLARRGGLPSPFGALP